MSEVERSARSQLRLLGVGDGWPSLERNHSAFLYTFSGACVLIDCGESVSRGLRQARVDWDGIDAIFLSHFHADHIGGFFMLVQSLWLKRRQRPLTVYLPRDGIEPIRNVLWAACLFDSLLPFELKFVGLEHRSPIVLGALTVTPSRTGHLDRLAAMVPQERTHRFEAFAFLLEHGTERCVHSADVGSPEDLRFAFDRPVTHLLCELAHFEPDELVAFLQSVGYRGRVTLTHLPDPLWTRRDEVTRALRESLPELAIEAPADGALVDL